MSDKRIYEVIIIGAGPSGLTAGIYALRAGMQSLLLEKLAVGGQIALTEKIENYPGFPDGIEGLLLVQKMEEQAKKFGIEIIQEEANKIRIVEDKISEFKIFEILTEKNVHQAMSVIISTGAEPRKLNVLGEEEFKGKGVSYCATCDGPFFKEKDVFVIGGGDAAVEEALFLTRFANKVNLVHRRDRLRATKILQERVYSNPKIEIIFDSVTSSIHGRENVKSIKIKNLKTLDVKEIPCDGIFICAGFTPNTKFLQGLIRLDENGYIITSENMETSIKGIFACGDVRRKRLKQVITACADGAIAAVSCKEYIEELKGTS